MVMPTPVCVARVNMFGNKCIECADAALGLASRFVLDTQLIASSTQGHSRHASDARLYGRTARNSAKYIDCLGNSADCWLYMKPCKDIKLCEKHPCPVFLYTRVWWRDVIS